MREPFESGRAQGRHSALSGAIKVSGLMGNKQGLCSPAEQDLNLTPPLTMLS